MTKATILKLVEEQKNCEIVEIDYFFAIVNITSELQTRQTVEISNFETELENIEDDEILKVLVKTLKRARNEFWSRNISAAIFYPKFTAAEGTLIAEEWIRKVFHFSSDNSRKISFSLLQSTFLYSAHFSLNNEKSTFLER
jgi:hypothetical protein